MTDLEKAFDNWAKHVVAHPEGTPPQHPVRKAIRDAATKVLDAKAQVINSSGEQNQCSR